MMVEIVEATSPALIGQTRALLVRYGVENGLTPENSKRFYEDLESLPGRYARPHGRLWVALEGGRSSAMSVCAGLAIAHVR